MFFKLIRSYYSYFTIAFLLGFSSCVPYSTLRYIAHDGKSSLDTISIEKLPEYTLEPGDLVNLSVKSTSENNIDILNKVFTSPVGTIGGVGEIATYLNGYILDNEGEVELPYLGKIKFQGLTPNEAGALVEAKLGDYLNHITVTVKLMSFRVSCLGEVNRPGTQVFYQKKLNIFQALASAGDMTDYANRKRVKLIRQGENKTQIYTFDLTKKDPFNQIYYQLRPNDIIYVQPLRAKVFKANSTNIGLAISIVTFAFVVLSYSLSLRK